MADETLHSKIRDTVRRVPPGAVATYGQIAAEAGAPRRARLVGTVLRRLPAGSDVPSILSPLSRPLQPVSSYNCTHQSQLCDWSP